MHTKTQKLVLQGGLILLGALIVSSIGGWARGAAADDQPAPVTGPAMLGELHSLTQQLEATRGELAVARLQLERANAIIDYSGRYNIPAPLAAARNRANAARRSSTAAPGRCGSDCGDPVPAIDGDHRAGHIGTRR